MNTLEKFNKLLKSNKRFPIEKAPYALVAPLALEGRLNKTKVLDIFDSAEHAYEVAQRRGHMAIHVPTLAHVGKVIHEVDIGRVYQVLRKYAITKSWPGLEAKWEGWSVVTTSRSRAAKILSNETIDLPLHLLIDEFFLEEIDS